ncbi:hypothetical protein A4A49_33403 [Nicotiana attenuata]|uniref:Uncharacterized protein n=1 Tax=Nicotiana attenuata TaxID=49451 RepID=A0A1J6KSG1_NICAT|nr:hypothetical protein A4A49_33403 [Nicotiana attenuata]
MESSTTSHKRLKLKPEIRPNFSPVFVYHLYFISGEIVKSIILGDLQQECCLELLLHWATVEDGPDTINGPQPIEEPPLEEFETVIGGEGVAADGKDFSGNVEEEVASVENLKGGEGADEEEVASEVARSESDLDELPDEDDREVDEESRTFRNERITKKNATGRKKQPETASVPVGEAGIDRGQHPQNQRQQEDLHLLEKRGRGSGLATAESSTASGEKRPRTVGFGCYINTETGRTMLNPGLSSERVVDHGTRVKSALM